MADEAAAFHGFPITMPVGRRSPTVNEHPKQPQQQLSPCTTQSPLSATTQSEADALSAYYTPSHVASPHTAETVLPGHVPGSSRSQGRDAGGTQDSRVGHLHRDLVLGQNQCRQYGSEELQQRLEVMWPNQQLKLGNYDRGAAQGLAPDKAASDFAGSSLSANPLQDSDHYEKRLLKQHAWPSDPQNPLQQSIWRPFHPASQISSNPPLYWPSRLGLVASMDDFPSNIHPDSYSGMADDLKLEAADTDYLDFIPTSSSYPDFQTGVDTIATPALSSLRTSPTAAYEAPRGMPQDQEDNLEFSEWGVDRDDGMGYKEDLWCPEDEPPSIEPSGGKVDEPYAQLIYKAFMSTPNKSMNLQQIYEWFRNNTDKAKSEGKGWQNSIRHNLSMNGAFTKRNSKAAVRDPNDGSLSFDPAIDGRKSTEWYLEPKFIGGVESTTRYRRGNSGNRSRASGSAHTRGPRHSGDAHGGYSNGRVSAGRKGGNVAAQNRRRQAEKQQHARAQMAAAMARSEQTGLQYSGPVPIPYQGFPDQEGAVQYYGAPTHPNSSPYVPEFDGLPAMIEQSQGREHSGQDGRHMDINYFQPPDLTANVSMERSATLEADEPHVSEPRTPPETGMCPKRTDEGLVVGRGRGSKHHESPADMMGLYHHPMDPIHPQGQPAAQLYGGGSDQLLHGHLNEWSLRDVPAIWEAPAGGPQPSVFLDSADPETVDEAALFGIFDNSMPH